MASFIAKHGIAQYPVNVTNAKAIEMSMSNSRKVFRFLRFFVVLVEAENLIRFSNKKSYLKALILINLIYSFSYYLLDNVVWAVSVGIINRTISKFNLKWKKSKDTCGIGRVITNLIISIIAARNSIIKERKVKK